MNNLLISSFLAGFAISIGGYSYLMSSNPIVGAILFSIGLFLVCTMKYTLFTGKICYLFSDELYNIGYMAIVLILNFAGSCIAGLLTKIANPNTIDRATQICNTKLAETNSSVIVLGILCNIMIYYAVTEFAHCQSEFGKYISIILCVTIFVSNKFEHCVANMYYFTVAGYTHGWIKYLFFNVIGNSIGGIAIYRLHKLSKEE